MKYLMGILALAVVNFAWAEDKNTSEVHPTAVYSLDIEVRSIPNRVIEFTPKGNRDIRCILVGRENLACYKAGEE